MLEICVLLCLPALLSYIASKQLQKRLEKRIETLETVLLSKTDKQLEVCEEATEARKPITDILSEIYDQKLK